jgi:hypothetical protein
VDELLEVHVLGIDRFDLTETTSIGVTRSRRAPCPSRLITKSGRSASVMVLSSAITMTGADNGGDQSEDLIRGTATIRRIVEKGDVIHLSLTGRFAHRRHEFFPGPIARRSGLAHDAMAVLTAGS